jgi:hypothetical protein
MNDEIYSISKELGNYSVSNYGNVINKKTGAGLLQTVKNGGKSVTLFKDGRRRQIAVCRLVAFSFVENTNKLPFVKHIDNDKNNNYYKNLEWFSNGTPIEGFHKKWSGVFY